MLLGTLPVKSLLIVGLLELAGVGDCWLEEVEKVSTLRVFICFGGVFGFSR